MNAPPKIAIIVVSAWFAGAQAHPVGPTASPPAVAASVSPATMRIPGTEYVVRLDRRAAAPQASLPERALMQAIVVWLADNFGLPRDADLPTVRRETATRITAMHNGDALSDDPQYRYATPPGERTVIATYDSLSGTVYLPEAWQGRTAAELSILVHEMVHHLQHRGHRRYACVEAGEALAFDAQDRWLGLFGSDLATEFQIDGFTRLAATLCLHP